MKNNFLKILNLTVLMSVSSGLCAQAIESEKREGDTLAAQPFPVIHLKEQPQSTSDLAKPVNKRVRKSRRPTPLPLPFCPTQEQTTWDLSNQNLTYPHLLTLRKEFKKYPQITTLNLGNNNINDFMIDSIVSAIHGHPSLKELNLSHNDIDDKGLELIMDKAEGIPTLKSINLSHNHIHHLSFACTFPQNNHIEMLDLSYNYIQMWYGSVDMLLGNHALKKFIITNQSRIEENNEVIRERAKLNLEPYAEELTMEIIY